VPAYRDEPRLQQMGTSFSLHSARSTQSRLSSFFNATYTLSPRAWRNMHAALSIVEDRTAENGYVYLVPVYPDSEERKKKNPGDSLTSYEFGSADPSSEAAFALRIFQSSAPLIARNRRHSARWSSTTCNVTITQHARTDLVTIWSLLMRTKCDSPEQVSARKFPHRLRPARHTVCLLSRCAHPAARRNRPSAQSEAERPSRSRLSQITSCHLASLDLARTSGEVHAC